MKRTTADGREYVERRLYYGQCSKCPRMFKSLFRSRIKHGICGVCRHKDARISPGQEVLFVGGSL